MRAIKSKKFVLINISGKQFAMPLADAQNFLQLKKIVPIPKLNTNILGLTYNNGHIVTVLATAKILNLSLSAEDKQCVIVEVDSHYYGLLIRRAGQVIEVKRVLNSQSKKSKSLLTKYISINNKKVFILNKNELVDQVLDD